MPNDTIITVTGNVTAEPELKRLNDGKALVNLTIASTPSRYDKDSGGYIDGETMFLRATAWRNLAENIALSVHKGSLVIAQGKLISRSYIDKNDAQQTVLQLDLIELGVGLSKAAKTEEIRPEALTDTPF